MELLVGVGERIAFIMLVFKYFMAISISSFAFSEIEAEVEWLKTSLKRCQLVSWLWIRSLGGFSFIAEPTVAITGEWLEESSAEELIWKYLGEIFLVMKRASKSGILLLSVGQYVSTYVVCSNLYWARPLALHRAIHIVFILLLCVLIYPWRV